MSKAGLKSVARAVLYGLIVKQAAVVVPFACHMAVLAGLDEFFQSAPEQFRSGRNEMKLFHAAGRALNASRMSGSIMNLSCDGGNAARPLSVISPRVSSRRHRSLFNSVHLLFLERRLKRCSVVPPMFFTVESIHPKHRASSTASRYHCPAFCFPVMVFYKPFPERIAAGGGNDVYGCHFCINSSAVNVRKCSVRMSPKSDVLPCSV